MKAGGDAVKKETPASGEATEKEKKNDGSTETKEDSGKATVNGVKVKSVDNDRKTTPSNYSYILQMENLPGSPGELLGSVTFSPHGGPDSGHAVRTSARVIQKLRMDTARPPTPPPPEKKEKKEKEEPVPPKQANPPPRINRILWSNVERNIFFEALNEYGRDFEAIAHFMNHKLKRKQPLEQPMFKMFQVRQLYYQTFHKISKYLKFSDDVRKYAQELYALINYGEMRRKLIFVNEKACMKLRELVYRGYVTIREKGRNIRIKTPSCRALRKLNQLEEWQEEIKLPQRVEVSLVPANMESWAKVQSMAQNPRIRATVPLQKRVLSVLKLLQNKWQSQEIRLCSRSAPTQCHSSGGKSKICKLMQQHQKNELKEELICAEKLLCLAPPPKTVIHRPMVNLTEFSSSYNICLNSYEERIGATVRGETLFPEKWQNHREFVRAQKRQRHDSGSDNKSPDTKKIRGGVAQQNAQPESAPESQISFQAIDFSAIINSQDSNLQPLLVPQEMVEEKKVEEPEVPPVKPAPETTKKKREPKWNPLKDAPTNKRNITKFFKPLIREEVIRKIKEGWTINNICDVTFGDLYVMFGSDFKINLEYRWVDPPPKVEQSEASSGEEKNDVTDNHPVPVVVKIEPPETEDFNKLMTEKPSLPTDKESEILLGRKLSQLLLISSMMDKTGRRRTTCSCGHICDKSFKVRESDDGALFKHPVVPPRNFPDSYRYVNVMRNNRAFRWLKPRSHRSAFPSRQVVVQRILPLQPGVKSSYVTASVDYEEPPSPTQMSTAPPQPLKSKFSSVASKTSAPTATVTSRSVQHKVETPKPESSVRKSEKTEKEPESNDMKSIAEKMLKEESVESEDFSIEDNPAIRSIMELSLPSLRFGDSDESRLMGDGFIPSATPPMSPMRIIREGSDSKWLEENMHDYSFSSLLGHLDSHLECRTKSPVSEENNHVDSSIDYVYKFA